MLTQSDADALIAMPKKRISNQIFYFPLPGEALSIPLHSQNDGEEFIIDINRGKLRLTKCTYQERHNLIIILVRLDVDGPPHTNPELSAVPLPATNDRFVNTTDLYKTLHDFFSYCNVIDPPAIQKSIMQRRLFP